MSKEPKTADSDFMAQDRTKVDLIDRAEAQTALQFAARRYTLAHEAQALGMVVWSDNLIRVTDAMNALREVPSAQVNAESTQNLTQDSVLETHKPVENTCSEQGDSSELGVKTWETCTDCVSRQAAIEAIFSEPIYKSGMKKRYADAVVPAIYEKIKSLPSAQPDVPDTNVGDMINRQDVLALAKDVILINGAKHRCIDATQIHELPSAQPGRCEGCGNFNKTRLLISQPERKKGKWIDVNGNGSLYECDQCHDRSCCAGKYCMECGARMEVEE